MTPAPAEAVGPEVLARALAARLPEAPDSILYLSRSDLEPARALEACFPKAEVVCRTKADFQGKSALQVLRALRDRRYDLFVFHDRPAFLRRLDDLYRLAAIGVRARHRYLLAAEIARGRVVPPWGLEEVRSLRALPGLTGRLLAEAAAVGPLILFTPARLSGGRARRARFTKKPAYRIAYLRTDYSFGIAAGGSVSHTSGVTGGMLAAGHSVRFIASDDVPDVDRLKTPVTVIPPGGRVRLFDEAAMVAYHHRFVAEARRLLEADRPDILYQRHSVFNAAGARLARDLGVPLVLEANYSEVEARAMWSRLQLRKLAERMERFAFQNADVLVTVSRIGAEALVPKGADPARILVNPNGVDPERFRPDIDGARIRREHGWQPDDVVCGFLGTFTRWHGVLFLAEQVVELVRRHPSVRFLFMGDGDLRSAVEDRLESAGVGRACAFTGLIDHHAVPAHLAASDLLVSPHLPFEDGTPFFGSPTKLFEYMAMGRAVVASNLGQIGEVIEDEKSGMLYPPGAAEAFLERMSRVIGDADLRGRLGAAARQRVIDNYTWQRNSERVIARLEQQHES